MPFDARNMLVHPVQMIKKLRCNIIGFIRQTISVEEFSNLFTWSLQVGLNEWLFVRCLFYHAIYLVNGIVLCIKPKTDYERKNNSPGEIVHGRRAHFTCLAVNQVYLKLKVCIYREKGNLWMRLVSSVGDEIPLGERDWMKEGKRKKKKK